MSLDRRSEETLDFDIQVEKAIFETAGQSRAYGGFADTADACEEYTHDLTFGVSHLIPQELGSDN
jgi:hypothetical protein